MSRIKQNLLICALFLCAFLAWEVIDVPTVFAQNAAPATDQNTGNPINATLATLAHVTMFGKTMVLMVLQVLEYFMNTEFYSAPGMSSALRMIWQISRDIMNYIFLFLLMGAALWTVIKANKDFIKEKFASFVIAVICVNFSWFFPRVVIDIASVLTNTVFALPSFIQQGDWRCINDRTNNHPCRVMSFSKNSFDYEKATQECDTFTGYNAALNLPCDCIEDVACWNYETYRDAREKKGYAYATFNTFATSIINIPNLDKIYENAAGNNQPQIGFQGTVKLGIGIMITAFILLATLFPLIALLLALMMRIVIIWVCTAFMPFAFLGYVVKGEFGNLLTGDYNIWKEFVAAVFIPVYFGIPMSIGIIMLSAAAKIPVPTGNEIAVPFLAAVNGVWGFTWMIAALMIMWIGTFAAFQGSKIISAVTNKVKGIGESIGGGLANIAAAEVVIPLPGKGGGAMSGLDVMKFTKNPGAVLNPIAEDRSKNTKITAERDKLMRNDPSLTSEEATRIATNNVNGRMGNRNGPGAVRDTELHREDERLRKLGDQIDALRDAYKNANTTKQKEVTEQINNQFKIDVRTSSNPVADLQGAASVLREQRKSIGKNNSVIDDLDAKLTELDKEIKKPKPANP